MIGRSLDTGPLTPPPPVRPAEQPGNSVSLGTTLVSGVPPYADDEIVLAKVRERNRVPGVITDPGRPRFAVGKTDATDQAIGSTSRWVDVKPEIKGQLILMTNQEREAVYGTADPVKIQEMILGSTPSNLSGDLPPQLQDELAHMTIRERLERFGTSNLKEIQRILLEEPHDDVDRQLSARVQMEVMRMSPSKRLTHFGTTNLDVIRRILHHRIEAESEKAMRRPGPESRIPHRWGATGALINEENPRPARLETDETRHEPEIVNPFIARLEAIRSLHPQAEVLIHRIQEGQRVSETMVNNLEAIATQVKAAREEAGAVRQAAELNKVENADAISISTDRPDNKIPHPASVVNAEPLKKEQGFVAGLRSLFGGLISNPFRGSLPDSE